MKLDPKYFNHLSLHQNIVYEAWSWDLLELDDSECLVNFDYENNISKHPGRFTYKDFLQLFFQDHDLIYKENNAIIPFTQRISLDQPQHYWQQANQEIHLSKQLTPNKFYKQAIYIGRIPLHFGHFLIEGLPKMSDLPFLNLPFIGFLTRGNLPPETNTLKESEARKLINLISNNQFIEIETNDQIKVDQLFFSKPPLTISHTVHDPQKMSKLIKHITTECHKIHNIQPIDTLYLNRIDEEILNISNDPNSELTLQIDKVANAKTLLGKTGSNTHLSMFANNKTITNFTPRGNPYDTDRNQLLCELIRMYNE